MRNRASLLSLEIAAWAVCIVFLAPVMLVFVNSFKTFQEVMFEPASLPRGLNWENYVVVWRRMKYLRVLFNTVYISVLGVAGVVLIGSMAGYKLSRTRTPLSGVVFGGILASMMVPFQVLMIPIARIASTFGFYNSIPALAVVYWGTSASLAVLLYHGFTKTIPMELEDAATIDGCGSVQMFFRIIFPVLKPVTTTIAVLYTLQYWNALILPLILLTDKSLSTLTLSQLQFYGELVSSRWNQLLAAGVLAFLPIIAFFLAMQRHIIGGLLSGAVKQ